MSWLVGVVRWMLARIHPQPRALYCPSCWDVHPGTCSELTRCLSIR